MQKRGKDAVLNLGVGLVVLSGLAFAAVGVAAGEGAGLVILGAGIVVVGLVAGAAVGGGEGDSGGDVGAGSGGEEGGGEEGGCFTAGTLVMLADGEMKPIETVKVGEYVFSREETTGAIKPQRIRRIWSHDVASTLFLHLTNGKRIETTKEHRFFVAERGFVGAGRLDAGSTLINFSGQDVQVTALEPSPRRANVYNLEIENFHTYFIGDGGLWVHNRKESSPFE